MSLLISAEPTWSQYERMVLLLEDDLSLPHDTMVNGNSDCWLTTVFGLIILYGVPNTILTAVHGNWVDVQHTLFLRSNSVESGTCFYFSDRF